SLLFLYMYRQVGPAMQFYTLVGIFFFLNIAYDFFSQLGKSIPVKHLILLIALLQWVVAPFFSYHYYLDSQFYFMQILEKQYMSYIVPVVICFIIGLFFPFYSKKNFDFLEKINIYKIEANYMIRRGRFLFWTGL